MIEAILFALAVAAPASPVETKPMTIYDLTAETLEGAPESLGDFKGKVLLVVNTASECGFTPQYAGLESLYERLKDRGFVVLGFPSNDFGGQEPGSPAQIKTFCEKTYRITFPMFAKVKTKGAGQSPVYAFLAAGHGEPKWNFHKYLVGRDGRVVAAFPSAVKPESAELAAEIDAALAAPVAP